MPSKRRLESVIFFIWVNVMVAIISEVYAHEVERSLHICWDDDFHGMLPTIAQPENDMMAMQPHKPLQTHDCPELPAPPAVALTPDKCAVLC